MGGAIGEGNVTPAAEFNIWGDPEAADRVFSSGLDVTMIGLDVTHRAIFGPEPTRRLQTAGRVGAMVAELLEFYGRFHRETYGWDGSPIHDAVALAHAFRAGHRRDRPHRRPRRLERRARPRADERRPSRAGRMGAERARRSRHRRRRVHRAPGRANLVARVKLGVLTLQNAPWPELVERWRTLDELGVETIWVADHLANWMHPEQPWFEAWTCVTALAHVTERPRIGPLVSPMTLRNPAVLARTALTVAELSGGRLELGVGSGRSGSLDHELAEVTRWEPGQRAGLFAEWVDRLVELVADERFQPKVDVPLTVAGRGQAILGVAARHATRWNTFGGVGLEPEEAVRRRPRGQPPPRRALHRHGPHRAPLGPARLLVRRRDPVAV